MAKAIMIQGTMSGVGKSMIAAGLCRILKEDGVKVAPFKAQETSGNSYVTREGLEMGCSLVMQAEAAGTPPSVLMNPVLLKPVSETELQVIVNGEVAGVMDAEDYQSFKSELIPYVRESYELLSEKYDVIVIEGEESPAEFRPNDFMNMGLAKFAKAPVIIVGDVDRGGVFAQLYGTVELLEEYEKKWVKGLIINKYTQKEELLEQGIRALERRTHKRVVGAVPYMHADFEEAGGTCQEAEGDKKTAKIDIAVVRFPEIANYTDFAALERLNSIHVRYISSPDEMEYPDMIILPGTKNTVGDLTWLRESGMEEKILNQYKQGTMIFGICGGYQMLGTAISDPLSIGFGGSIQGLGLLPVETVLEEESERTKIGGKLETVMGPYEKLSKAEYSGYEIHMGQTKALEPVRTLLQQDGRLLGTCKGRVAGAYMHGFFDSREISGAILNILAAQKGIRIEAEQEDSYADQKEEQYGILAAQLRECLDMKRIYEMIQKGEDYDGKY